MTEDLSLPALFRLQTFLSPAFPIGAFTYSHGLEQVIDEGAVSSAAELSCWLEDILRFGAGRSDAILLKESFRAANKSDTQAISELRELGLALQPSKERHLETCALGTAFADAIARSWLPETRTPAADLFRSLAAADDEPWPYPVALGLVAAAHDLPESAVLTAFLHAFAANLISVAVRVVPLGQSDGQKVLAGLEPVIFEVAKEAAAAGLDDLGTSTFLADIASMAHETQYSRLFRS
ncbi:urease accessory protein UreF [Roseibium sp. M-1]